jgi:hypothetical protein
MTEHTQIVPRSPDDIAGRVPEVAQARQEIVERENKQLVEMRNRGIVAPYSVPQSTFPETMKQGIHGMVNRMVDYNAVTRSVEGPPTGIGPGRAVSQSTAFDINCILGGTVVGFVGITILDPTNIVPIGSAVPIDFTPQYMNIGVLTKGEIFIVATVSTLPGDPVHFGGVDGVLTNTGGIGPIPGARWKYARPANELNVVQLGIQR